MVAGGNVEEAAYTDVATGKLINSGFLNGLEVADAKVAMIKHLEERVKIFAYIFSRTCSHYVIHKVIHERTERLGEIKQTSVDRRGFAKRFEYTRCNNGEIIVFGNNIYH